MRCVHQRLRESHNKKTPGALAKPSHQLEATWPPIAPSPQTIERSLLQLGRPEANGSMPPQSPPHRCAALTTFPNS